VPASAVVRRPKGSRLGPERWGALQPDHAHTHLHKRNSRHEGRQAGMQVAAHGTTLSAGALDFTMVRSWPWCVGVRPSRTHARIHLQRESYNAKAETQRRGTCRRVAARLAASRLGHDLEALGCAQPCRAHAFICKGSSRHTGEHQRGMVGTGLTLALGCARSPPARPHPCTTPPRHEGRPQEHKARRVRGAWHDDASWGSPWFDEPSCNTTTC
jgi:hypothetical protein